MTSPFLIGVVTLLYIGVAVNELFMKQNIGACIVWSGYAFANIGLIMMTMK